MMADALEFDKIGWAYDFLDGLDLEDQILQIKNLCENNGVWAIPEKDCRYSPVLYEISLFGVSAIADDVAHLPKNWLKAARNTLLGCPQIQDAIKCALIEHRPR